MKNRIDISNELEKKELEEEKEEADRQKKVKISVLSNKINNVDAYDKKKNVKSVEEQNLS